jgi:AraC-like DNA-binding protein
MQGQPNLIAFGERKSESPHVLRLWRAESSRNGEFISVAYPQWEIVIARVAGKLDVVVRGPETAASRATVPADGSWLGVRFRSGTVMKGIDHAGICDTSVTLPITGENQIWLDGDAWEVPTFENADDFVTRLSERGMLARDPTVSFALAGESAIAGHLRTLQRRFTKSTGLSRQAIIAIERAQVAAVMLREGCAISDTISATRFSDQAHLTRSLKRLIGLTPGQLLRLDELQVSFIPTPEGDYNRNAAERLL